jgi:formate dehydrogenase major subunit
MNRRNAGDRPIPDAHPVFASRMKKRLREAPSSSSLIHAASTCGALAPVVADFHLPLQPGTNVPWSMRCPMSFSPRAENKAYIAERCDPNLPADYSSGSREFAEARDIASVAAADVRARGFMPRAAMAPSITGLA